MSSVKISWEDSAALEGGKCDFCGGPLTDVVPVLDITAIGELPGDTLVMGGLWAACGRCQGQMGIEPGAGEVELELVRRRHQEEVDRFFRGASSRDLRVFFRSRVYGGG